MRTLDRHAHSELDRLPWSVALAQARSTLEGAPIDATALAAAAPRLVDTVDRERLLEVMRRTPPAEISARSGLAFVAGYAALLEGATASGIGWLTRAESLLQPHETLLGARIAFELGAVYLAGNSAMPADVLLLRMARPADTPSGDLLHLRALSAEAMGDGARAISLYRQAIQADAQTLSPSTRVLAMINLAASCSHRDPGEALALSELALAMIGAHELHDRLRPPALNIMGYALICLGQFAEARDALEMAASEAGRHDYRRIELYAAFNQAIVDELVGECGAAEVGLRDVGVRAAERFPELAAWVRIRSVWLAWLGGDPEAVRMLSDTEATLQSMRYAESILCLKGLIESSQGKRSKAIAAFESLRRSASARGDSATEVAYLLRLAHLERGTTTGEHRALRHANRALRILRNSTFRASPNWWSAEIVDSFTALVGEPIARGLVRPVLHRREPDGRSDVLLASDGAATVAGAEVKLDWKVGRTGSGVLRRMFRLLLQSHPRSVARDALADVLWPDSEGDVAVRNLYSATNDLRKVLVDLPGVELELTTGGYCLRLDQNVGLIRN